jgi:outer membrane protein, heavy metal efflux system
MKSAVRNMAAMRFRIGIFFLVLGVGGVATAGERYLSFEEAYQIALHENVDLLALREQAEGLKHQSKQALGPNEPVFSYSRVDSQSLGLTQTPAETQYQVAWTLGFPGKALSQSASVRHQSEATNEQALNQEINLLTTLSNSYVAFVTNDAFYKFLLEEQRKDKDLIKLLEKRYGASQAAKVDLLNAKVVTQQIAQSILQNRNDYDLQITQFRQIIKRPTDKTLFPRIPEKIVIPAVNKSFEDLVEMMNKNSHAIAQAQRQVDSTGSLLTNAKLQMLPDLQLTGSVNDWLPASAPNQGTNQSYTIGVGIVVPIFFAFNELEGVHAAAHNNSAAEYQLTSQQLQGLSALQTAYTSLKATLKDLDASERLVVPAAKESYDLTLLTYGLGKSDYISLNQSRNAWHDAMRDMFTKRQNAAQFYNQLIAQVGCDISKTGGSNACN